MECLLTGKDTSGKRKKEEEKICLPCLERPNLSHRHAHIQEEDCLANHTFATESAEEKKTCEVIIRAYTEYIHNTSGMGYIISDNSPYTYNLQKIHTASTCL